MRLFSPGFMMLSCWMLRNYVNECVPAQSDAETRRRGKTHTHSALSALTKQFPWKGRKERGEEERFKICCQERNRLHSSTQKPEQSFIFAFRSCKCNCGVKSVQMSNKTWLKNEGGLPGYSPPMNKIKDNVSILEISLLLENKELANIVF